MTDYQTRRREEGRLTILKALAAQADERLSSAYLQEELLRYSGIDEPRAWVHGEIDWLESMGAVSVLRTEGSVVIASLTEKGARHLRRAIVIEGVKRPARPGE